MIKMSEYDEKAKKFLQETNTKIEISFKKHDKYFIDDKETRDIYEVKVVRGDREWAFTFGQSIAESGIHLYNKKIGKTLPVKDWDMSKRTEHDLKVLRMKMTKHYGSIAGYDIIVGKPPTEYDILASITKYDPSTLEDFCRDLGYDPDSKKAEKIYKDVCTEWLNCQRIWSEKEIETLREIE